jgi:hypothetical protein
LEIPDLNLTGDKAKIAKLWIAARALEYLGDGESGDKRYQICSAEFDVNEVSTNV